MLMAVAVQLTSQMAFLFGIGCSMAALLQIVLIPPTPMMTERFMSAILYI
jgi:hypothetical protein